jgi:hypothetical protein
MKYQLGEKKHLAKFNYYFFKLFFIVLLFICAYKAWVISPNYY